MGSCLSSQTVVQDIKNQKVAKNQKNLQDKVKLGAFEISNRVVMAPMTRCRADPKTNVPQEIMGEYYSQRAGFGLIISECAPVSALGNGYPGAGGIYTQEQVQGWKKVVDQVHKKGGKIVLQLWHCGRAVVPEFIGGESPISASSIPVKGNHQMTNQPHPVPREASLEDIRELVEQHRVAAQNAKKAGFDGVQISAANGSLHDQFLKNGTNKRIDRYGGSVENRCRFLFECIAAVQKSFSANRISVRLTPTGRSQDMYDSNPYALLQYLLPELQKLDLQFLEVKRHAETDAKESSPGSGKDEEGRTLPWKQIPGDYYETIRGLYSGKIMANEGFNPQSAQELLNQGHVDVVSFGKLAISNPDLPERIRNGWPLNENVDWAHIFQGGATGYTDYPNYRQN